jgi:exo-1,4-beta-D-glucosaminidase
VSREVKEDTEILPVLWEDNYFALLPGESRQVKATYAADSKSNAHPVVEIEGWNVNHTIAKLQ